MDVEKICRTCLSLAGPFVPIYASYEGSTSGNAGCLSDMLREFTQTKPRREDNLHVCLSCISEINHCYSFKMKCENSIRTLRQLIPNALSEENELTTQVQRNVSNIHKSVQTDTALTTSSEVQTDNSALQSTANSTISEAVAEEEESDVEGVVDDLYEIAALEVEDPSIAIGALTKPSEENITLHVEKDNIKYETEMIYNQKTGEVSEQPAQKSLSKQKEYKFTIFNNANGETEIAPAEISTATTQVTTRKSAAAKLLRQKQQQNEQQVSLPVKRSVRLRGSAKLDELGQEQLERIPPKQLKTNNGRKALKHVGSNADPNNSCTPNDVKLKYHCERCNAGFALEKSLVIHRRQNSCTNRNFKCDECGRVFVSLAHLTDHQTTHGAFKCTECGRQFETKEQLGQHMVQGHKRNMRNQCNLCQKVFTMLSTLRDHMRIHTGEKPFVCNVCGKRFTQNANLRQHQMRHSDIKRFKCSQCSNSFVTKAELASHSRTHTGDKPFECQVCRAKFTTSCSLAKHKRKHTGERPYGCDLCPMRFTALNVLKNHRRTHTGERPYVCPHCSKSFTQRGDCQMHQRTHQGERLYICPVCSEEFRSMGDMRKHLVVHEQEDKRLVHFTLLNSKETDEDDDNGIDDVALII